MNKIELTPEQEKIINDRKPYTYISCPVCGIGKFGGIFNVCCDNKSCKLYNEWIMAKCRNCNDSHRECSC